ncbi:hypothetical protein ACWDOP_15155 [Nocardia sp. NPDC003693]
MITASTRGGARRTRRGIGGRSAAALLAALAAVFLAPAFTPAVAEASGPPCLWAGVSYSQGSTVYAGGWAFTCEREPFGTPRWARGAQTAERSTVPSPGALHNPAGVYSPGARQPGTEYNDYCVGSQLLDGSEAIYEVVPAGGYLYWRAAGPISWWSFDDMSTRHGPSTQSASRCYDNQ